MGLPSKSPTPTLMRSIRRAMISGESQIRYNIAYDRGSGALDRRQIFNVNYIYAAPLVHQERQRVRSGLPWEAGSSPG